MNFVYGQNAYVVDPFAQLCNLFNTAIHVRPISIDPRNLA